MKFQETFEKSESVRIEKQNSINENQIEIDHEVCAKMS